MRKVLFALCFGLSAAQAQTWMVQGPFRDDFLGCVRVASGQVQCSMKSTYMGSGATYFGASYYAVDSAAYAPDRKRYIASHSTIDGRDVTRASVNVSKANPVTVVYTFDYPRNFDKITMLFMDSGIIKDVPIKGNAIAPAPAPAQAPVTQPAAPAPVKAAPPTPAATTPPANLNLGAFDIRLLDCAMNSQGGITCNKAELVPKR